MSLLLLFVAISSMKSYVTGSRPCRLSEFCPKKASYMCYRELRIILTFPVLSYFVVT